MKKLFFALIITVMVAGCNQANQKESTTSGNSTEMKALYEANLAAYKIQIAAFEREDLNAWAATIADDAKWSSPVYGDTVHTKAHWVESVKSTFDNFDKLHLTDAQFLPGVDSATLKPDGSVRYYGTWNGTSKSGKEAGVKFYGTYNFNKDHKVISGDDFYDVGGLMNAVTSKK
jgi:ketosteroid isomerase-like protein